MTNDADKKKIDIFKDDLTKSVRNYINQNDGTVLTTDDFEALIKYYHLIDEIFAQILNVNSSLSKDAFVKKWIDRFHEIAKNPANKHSDSDIIIKEFIVVIYDRIDYFFSNCLSVEQKYMLSKINKSFAQNNEISSTILSKTDKIMGILKDSGQIVDKDQVYDVFEFFYQKIINAEIYEILRIKSYLHGKNEDLDECVSFLIDIFTINSSFKEKFKEIQKNIVDDQIYSDVCNVYIYLNLFRGNIDALSAINERIPEIKSVANALLNNDKDKFYAITEVESNEIRNILYEIKDCFPSEKWLIQRICALDIAKSLLRGRSNAINQIIDKKDSIIDSILILECDLQEAFYFNDLDKDKMVYAEAKSLEKKTCKLSNDLKARIFALLLRSAIFVSDEERKAVVARIPDDIKSNKDIELLLLDSEINEGADCKEKMMKLCNKHEQYWPLHNYIIKYFDDYPDKIINIIENYRYVLDKDPSIFFLYVRLMIKIDNNNLASKMLDDYHSKYSTYIDYWAIRMQIHYDDTEMTDVLEALKEEKLFIASKEYYVTLINILDDHERFNDLLFVIERLEKIGFPYAGLNKYKAYALTKLNREIEALAIYKDLYNSGEKTDGVIYNYLLLSYKNKRSIPDVMMKEIENSTKLENLVLLAELYVMNNNPEKAKAINLKAIFLEESLNNGALAQYLKLRLNDQNEDKDIECVSEETVAFLESDDGIASVYAIHPRGYLPKEKYKWNDANHIFKETAIQLDLYRRRVGDKVFIGNKEFGIKMIESLDSYLFKLSMKSQIENGNLKVTALPTDDTGKLNIEEASKTIASLVGDSSQTMKWLEEYQELDKVPMPFYIVQKSINVRMFQLVNAILMDETIIFREEKYQSNTETGEKYVFTYAALMALHNLGWPVSEKSEEYGVTRTLKNAVSEDVQEVINTNSRDNVSLIKVYKGELFMHESSDSDKRNEMRMAVEFQNYIEKFNTLDNYSDLHFNYDPKNKIKEVLGIADYDAIAISKSESRVLVSAELSLSAVACQPGIKIRTMCIADFLSNVVEDINDLFNHLKKMIDFKFQIPFTVLTIKRIVDALNNATNEEKKNIIEQWSELFAKLSDDEYIDLVIYNYRKCASEIKGDRDFIEQIYVILFLKMLEATNRLNMISDDVQGEKVKENVQYLKKIG